MPTIEQIINDLDRRVRRLEQGPRDFGAVHDVAPPPAPGFTDCSCSPSPVAYYLWDGEFIREMPHPPRVTAEAAARLSAAVGRMVDAPQIEPTPYEQMHSTWKAGELELLQMGGAWVQVTDTENGARLLHGLKTGVFPMYLFRRRPKP